MFSALLWWLIIQILGLLALPLAYRLFDHLPDRGYAFTKPVGLLGTSYVLWLLTTLGFLRNRWGGIVGCMLLVGVVGWWFYRRAAEGTLDPRNRQLLFDLAAMEDEHEKIFVSMREDLADAKRKPTVFDPDGQAALYLRAMVDGHVFDVKADPAELFTGKETMGDILQTAIGMEKV